MGFQVAEDRGGTPPDEESREWKRVTLVLLLVMLLLIATIFTTYYLTRPADEQDTLPSSAGTVFVRELSFTTSNGDADYEIEVPVPYDVPGIQDVHSVSYDPQPQRTYTGKGQAFAVWEGELRADRTITVSITYDVTLTATRWDLDAKTSGSTHDVPQDYDRYLGSEWLISPQEVENRSKEILGEETDVHTIVRSIYRWMRRNIDYAVDQAQPKPCGETLADGAGDGDDQAILFASLARAAGVPAWVVVGPLYDPDDGDWSLHMWNNVYIPTEDGGHQVVTVDVAKGRFLFRDPYRMSLWVSTGDGEDLRGIYTSWTYSYDASGPRPIVSSDDAFRTVEMRTED